MQQTRGNRRRRKIALFFFCVLATLGPRVIFNARHLLAHGGAGAGGFRMSATTLSLSPQKLFHFHNVDIATFVLSSLILTNTDQIRMEILHILHKFKATVQHVAKHSPPLRTMLKPNAPTTMTSSSSTAGRSTRQRATDPALRVTLLGVAINLVLSVGKWIVGMASHSSALLADAGHSLSDLFSDFVTLFAVQVARLPPDDDHPYGHGKFEALGSLFLAMTLLATGVSVGAMSNKNLLQIMTTTSTTAGGASLPTAAAVAIPKPPALFMAALSIISKEWLFRITQVVGKRLNSQVLLANAWHHRSDAYSSVLALISIGLAMFVPGLVAADSFAGLLVAGMICMTGADILGESIKQLSDHNNEELVQQVTNIVQQSLSSAAVHVETVEQVRARQVGSQAMVDVKVTTTLEHATQSSAAATRRLEEAIRQDILSHASVAHVILDAEVRALPPPTATTMTTTTANTLPAVSLEKNTLSSPTKQPAVSTRTTTTTRSKEVEELIQKQASTIEGIVNVEAVAVHIESQQQQDVISVDVAIRVAKNTDSFSSSTSDNNNKNHLELSHAKEMASQLRTSLQDINDIDEVRVFLDLNDNHDYENGRDKNRSSSKSSTSPPINASVATATTNGSPQQRKQIL